MSIVRNSKGKRLLRQQGKAAIRSRAYQPWVTQTSEVKPALNPILEEIEIRKRSLLEEGKRATDWAAFAPMVNIQTGGTVKPFVPYDFQIDFIETIDKNQNVVIVKSRQMGASESICSYLLMRCVTEPGFSAVVFSKTQADASELGRRVRDMAVSLGSLCPKMQSDSATKLVFKGLGRIHLLPVTARAARGIPSVSVVVFDEAAFIDGIDGVYQAAMPTLSMLGDRGKVIFNSTPNGRAGLFYRLMASDADESAKVARLLGEIREPADALTDRDRTKHYTRIWSHQKWAKVLLHWRTHPVYGEDPNWAEKTRKDRKLTLAQWNQEYELDFAEGQTSVFSFDLITRATRGEWRKRKEYLRRYIAGIDPNFGSSDFFSVRVWDITELPYRLVAQYRANYKTHVHNLSMAIALLQLFEPEQISIEVNGGGEIIYQEISATLPNMKFNPVRTSNASKLEWTDRLVLLLERDHLVFPADQTRNPSSEEYKHFIERINGVTRTREAESGFNDDTVMADAIAFSTINEWVNVFDVRDLLKTLG